jgi:hypothetical protein
MKPIGKIVLPAVVATAATRAPHALAIAGLLALLVALVCGKSMQTAAQTSTITDFPCPSNPALECVMSGLDNPREMAFGPEGALYVAEAGRGPSDHSCFDNPSQANCICPTCFLNPTAEQTQQHTCGISAGGISVCSGPTGAVTRLWHGLQERVVTGLPSWATRPGRAEGPNGLSLLGPGDAYVSIGLEAAPNSMESVRDVLGSAFGRLIRVALPSGDGRFVADFVAHENLFNPEPRILDSNPFGVLAVPGGAMIVDAGGNDLLRFDNDTLEISTLAVLPNDLSVSHDGDAVPTAVAIGPAGTHYVGQLTGAPFEDGKAKVYRFVPDALPDQELVPVCTGFKAIISLAFDSQGNLYVLQHSSGPTGLTGDGLIYRITASDLAAGVANPLACSRDVNATRVAVNISLKRPTSIVVGPDDALYVTNNGLTPGQGEVLRVVVP